MFVFVVLFGVAIAFGLAAVILAD